MTDFLFQFPEPFSKYDEGPVLPVTFLYAGNFETWEKEQSDSVKAQLRQTGFEAKAGQNVVIYGQDGVPEQILSGLSDPLTPYDGAAVYDFIVKNFSKNFIENVSFKFGNLSRPEDLEALSIGWGWAAYKYDRYKKSDSAQPLLIWPEGVDQKKVAANIESVCLIRNLVNTPANDLGTDELAEAAQHVAKHFKASFKKIVDKDLIKQNFPMIYEVGKSSPRRPQLIELNWGDKKNPKVTIVGKGIVFDTGGLDLKPPRFMALMKKDMGGSAHALGLAWMIMSLDLPVCLKVLIPAAENAVSGVAFRPGDILNTRKGLTVEMTDTDAEGRLVVAEALTYACEDNPDLLIDFCTLTGSARSALGYEIPAFFSNQESFLNELKDLSVHENDPVWPLPLWQPYLKEMDSKFADINSIGTGTAGAIHGGLFLQKFVEENISWIHLDIYSWEQSGKPGRPQGGADTGMRAVFKFLETRYA